MFVEWDRILKNESIYSYVVILLVDQRISMIEENIGQNF
jgi:hypothetical protein